MTAGSLLAYRKYLDRHNAVAELLHWNIYRHFNIETGDKWYLHLPKTVIDTFEVTVLWERQIQTDRQF